MRLTSQSKEPTSIFRRIIKDFGLFNLLQPEHLPSVLNQNDVAENLFTMIFAPSVPVVCDPTGQFEEFIKKNFL